MLYSIEGWAEPSQLMKYVIIPGLHGIDIIICEMKQRSFLLSYQRECSSSSNLSAAKKDPLPTNPYHTNPP